MTIDEDSNGRQVMKRAICWGMLIVVCFSSASAQQATTAASALGGNSAVPTLVNFNGTTTDTNGKSLGGLLGVTFSLYSVQQGGAPLWVETQNVRADGKGNFTAQLGITKSEGLPIALFASGEARWLGVQVQGQAEQSRVLLMSVPYALKALDAETVGGRPASSFVLAPAVPRTPGDGPAAPPGTITGTGSVDFVPIFTGKTTIGNSEIFQTAAGNIGIATTTPTANLDVKGTEDVRDTLTLFSKSTHPVLSLHGTALSVDHTGVVSFVSGQTFPGAGTVTSVGSGAGLTGGPITTKGTLSVKAGGVTNAMLANSSLTIAANSPLNGGGSVALGSSTSLGLKNCSNNQVLQFLSGAWTCANVGTGTGTVTSVGLSAPSSDFTVSGSPITKSGTLGLNWTVAPTNAGTANAIVKRDSAGGFDAGSVVANAFGSNNAVVGAAGAGVGVYGTASSGYGGYFNGGTSGAKAESDTDVYLNIALSGWEMGPSAETFGVFGYALSPNGVGVFGRGVNYSNTSGTYPPERGTGVWGDTSAQRGVGVYATVDDGWAFRGISNGNSATTMEISNAYSNPDDATALQAGGLGGICDILANGNLLCEGSKSAVVAVDGGARKVALYAVEAPENWFEDAGSGHLSNGEAVINLEPVFGQTVNTGVDYHVFLTPNGDCKGLYVAQKSATSFLVRELGSGTSSVDFDYRIMAKRKNYENIRLADKTKLFDSKRLRRAARPGTKPQQILDQHLPATPPVARMNQAAINQK